MPMNRVPDPEPDFNSDEWHEDEFGSSKRPYDAETCPVCGLPDNCGDCNHFGTPFYNACGWFVYCINEAVTTQAHPVLGDVPICARCLNIFEQRGG